MKSKALSKNAVLSKSITAFKKRSLLLCLFLPGILTAQEKRYAFPKEVQVYGLGEATHASMEFMQSKAAIILDLVKKNEVNSICFEMPFYNGFLFDQYIKSNDNISLSLALETANWMFNVKEMGALLDSLRHINQNRKGAEQVNIYGFDGQASSSDIQNVLMYLVPEVKTDSVLIQQLTNFKTVNVFMPDPASEAKIKKALESIRTSILPYSTSANSRQLHTFFDMALQDIEIKCHVRDTVNPGFALREKYNAHNIVACQKRTGKVVAWAHNYHIAKKHEYGITMGELLKKNYGDRYFSLGYAFMQGSCLAWSPGNQLKKQTVESPADYYPSKISYDQYGVVHLLNKDLPSTKENFIEIGSGFMGIELSTIVFIPSVSFDGMIIFEKIHAPDPNYPVQE